RVLQTEPAPTHPSPLSLHDALPISFGTLSPGRPLTSMIASRTREAKRHASDSTASSSGASSSSATAARSASSVRVVRSDGRRPRSEEHTSELQSREKLVCRLLLEKK